MGNIYFELPISTHAQLFILEIYEDLAGFTADLGYSKQLY
jgi:hypothetical protein